MSRTESFTVIGGRPLRGRARVPGDKGIAHRSLLLAAMAEGSSRLENVPDGEDVAATLEAVRALGVTVTSSGARELQVAGLGVNGLREPGEVVDCANSGTTMRMLAGLVSGRPFHTVLTGDPSLRSRPMGRVVEPLRAMGARIDGRDDAERAPLAIRGGRLDGRDHDLEIASAQVKTALLIAGLQATGPTVVREPHPSRDHTERLLDALGAPIERIDATTVTVRAGAPECFDLDVPGDPSSAAYFIVGACIVPGSAMVVEDVSINPTRLGFVDVLRRMGASIQVVETATRLGEPIGEIHAESSALRATTIEGAEVARVIDELPVIAVAAAVADGVTEIRDARELRVKETDRIAAIQQELSQLGVDIQATGDGLTVTGGGPLAASVLKSHGDHRIAMSAAVAALVADGASTVRGWRSVHVSYPRFAADLERLLDQT